MVIHLSISVLPTSVRNTIDTFAERRERCGDEKPIDIGMYGFQYVLRVPDLEKVYIGMTQKAKVMVAVGLTKAPTFVVPSLPWRNPSGNSSTGTGTGITSKRQVFVRGGTYYSPTYSSGDAFSLYCEQCR